MAGEKTEKPTPQRLKKSREEGQFLSSRGALGAAQFLVFIALIGNVLSVWSNHLGDAFIHLYQTALTAEIGPLEWVVLLRGFFFQTLTPLLMLGVALLLTTLSAQLAMTRVGFSLSRLTPQFNRLNPLTRLKDLPAQNLKSLGEAILLMVTLGLFLRSFLAEHVELLLRLPRESVRAAATQVFDAIHGLLWKAAALFIVFGAFDLFQNYRRQMKTLRMSKQEVREESKHNEGDPHIKQRIRQMRRQLLGRRMMREVPRATAVVVNPTHFAVAIRYDTETMASPIVVAKGKNWLALRIRQVAIENEVPVVENPPLARALYSAVEVGSAISPEFYKAIAEILAYVYRLMGRKLP
jgi:flagellar biosynthesis protein FlhB